MNTQFAGVLNAKLVSLGASASANRLTGSSDPRSRSDSNHDASAAWIRLLCRDLRRQQRWRQYRRPSARPRFRFRGSGVALNFEPFIVHRDGKDEAGIDVSFTFSVNGSSPVSYSFNRHYVNEVLNRDDGKVSSPEDMATLMQALLGTDWPDLIIQADAGSVVIKSNPDVDRQWGAGTRINFDNIRVSNEPRSTLNLLDLDIVKNHDLIDTYITYIENVTANSIDGAAMLGAIQTRIDLQAGFAASLSDSISRGIGRPVDADMNEESIRLKALQTQQQLGVQSLQIANSRSETILDLFR